MKPAIKDHKRIALEDPDELRVWAVLFERTTDDVRRAVAAVGPMSAAVAVYLHTVGRHDQITVG